MEEYTEREQKLINIIKSLITAMTIYGISYDGMVDFLKWKHKSIIAAGLDSDWQDDMIKVLNDDFGLKIEKITSKNKNESTKE